jgi:hypothetical protein
VGTLAGMPAVGRLLLGLVPAVLTVIFAGLIALIALFCNKERRDYALDVAERFVDLAAVLVAQPPKRARPRPSTRPPQAPVADLLGAAER